MVKLSVIVPFYNVQQYAPDTLKSLRANARQDFEFILVDDCSRDETPDILARAERELPGAVYVRHEKNGGLATARNTGIDRARGEYLTFLDGDDWLAPGYYEQLLASIEDLGCDFVRTDHVQCTARARTVHRVPHGRRGVVLNPRDAILPADRSTSVDYAYAWAGVYHRRLVDRGLLHFTDGLRTAEDRPWIWKLHREAESFATVGLLGRLLPAGGRLLAHPDRRRAPTRLPARLRPGGGGNRRGPGRGHDSCPRPCARIARSSPITWDPSKGSSRRWHGN